MTDVSLVLLEMARVGNDFYPLCEFGDIALIAQSMRGRSAMEDDESEEL